MKFKEYLERCNDILKTNPESADYDVIYAIDEEGNAFKLVEINPGLARWDGREDVVFEPDQEELFTFNAVVIN